MTIVRIALLALVSAGFVTGQLQSPAKLAVGKILITPRDAPDPLFAKSVIVLVRYEKAGVLGLIINRRGAVPISRVLRNVHGAAAHSEPMYIGGPVEMDTVFALMRGTKNPDGATKVVGGLWFTSAKPALEKALGAASGEKDLRVYAGYCGWGPGQLENEMRVSGWYVFDPDENMPFDAEPSTLWSRLVDRAEGHVARLGFSLAALR